MKNLCILIFLFSISVLIRLPNINRPLVNHQESITAHALITLQIWQTKGIRECFFSPIFTFNNKSDKFIANLRGIMDKEGNGYYISYPPFAFIFPYIIFNLINIFPDVLALQIFNMIFHFISGLLIFLIINSVYKKTDSLFLPSLIGFSIYIFNPYTMWFQSNVYFVDSMVQSLWIGAIYLTVKMISENKLTDGKYLFGIGVLTFLMNYTEWIGVFFSFTIFLLASFNLRKDKKFLILIVVIIISTVLSLSLTVFQYSQINGLNSFLDGAISKYKQRSGFSDLKTSMKNMNIWTLVSYKQLLHHYMFGYAPVIILLLVIFSLSFFKKANLRFFGRREYEVLFLSLLPVILHHVIFFNFTVVHDYSTLKTAVFFSLISGFLFHRSIIYFTKHKMKRRKIISAFAILLCVIFSLFQYQSLNNAPKSLRKFNLMVRMGEKINQESLPDETIFLFNYNFMPLQALFYAKRNVYCCGYSSEKITDFINRYKPNKIVIYIFDGDKFVNTERFSLNWVENERYDYEHQ